MPSTHDDAILALDLGTSSLKALLVDRYGTVHGRGSAAYPTYHPKPDQDEQRIDDWLTASIEASAIARHAAPRLQIVALSLTGQMHGTVLIDRDGDALMDAVIWSDRRATHQAAEIVERSGPSLASTIGGPLAPGFQAATLVWLTRHRPELIARLDVVLSPKDALIHALTEFRATDPSDAVGTGLFDAEHGRWHDSLINDCGLDPCWFPPVLPSGTPIVPLTPNAAAALDLAPGLPVVMAGGDASAAVVGAGLTSPGQELIVLSTGAQVIRPVTAYEPDATGRWHTWPSAGDDGGWNRIGAVINAGRAINWASALVDHAPTNDVRAKRVIVDAGADGLLFLPYLAGERCPIDDPDARGAFLGLTAHHGPEHIVRAALEGVALGIVHAHDVMNGGAEPPDEIILGGGGSRNRAWCQMFADILDHPVRVEDEADLSATGAARIAARALGWPDPVTSFSKRDTTTLHPDIRNIEAYARLRERFPLISAAARDLRALMP